jgi:hypothetical protein
MLRRATSMAGTVSLPLRLRGSVCCVLRRRRRTKQLARHLLSDRWASRPLCIGSTVGPATKHNESSSSFHRVIGRWQLWLKGYARTWPGPGTSCGCVATSCMSQQTPKAIMGSRATNGPSRPAGHCLWFLGLVQILTWLVLSKVSAQDN